MKRTCLRLTLIAVLLLYVLSVRAQFPGERTEPDEELVIEAAGAPQVPDYEQDCGCPVRQTDEPFTVVEQMPRFGESDQLFEFAMWIADRIRYPQELTHMGIEGRVIVSIVIDTDGQPVNPVVLRTPHDALSREAVRVICSSSGKWTPGRKAGKAVPVTLVIPVNFRQR